jgi:GTP-binding protein
MGERGSRSLGTSPLARPSGRLPVVAIVGLPNVGKSTLFNRLIGARKALVHDVPGVTRDRLTGEVHWGDRVFTVVDTGGFDPHPPADTLALKIQSHLEAAIRDADVILFVVDGRQDLQEGEREMARALLRSAKPVVTAVNKMERSAKPDGWYDYFELGIEPLCPISAAHGIGIGELLDAIVSRLPEAAAEAPADQGGADETIRVAVVGRANVGKSTFLNTLLGEERHLVHDAPGTTRDAVDSLLSAGGRDYLFIDTAGIRRKGKVRSVLEKYSVVKALQGLDRCDVALLMIDAEQGVTDQDAHIGGYILDRGKAVVVLLNKWDRVDDRHRRNPGRYIEGVRARLHHLSFAPVLRISAKTGYGVREALPVVDRVAGEYRKRIPTPELNRFFGEIVQAHPPRGSVQRQIKFSYVTQAAVGPPTFVVFTNTAERLHVTYQRYLVNQLRERFGFEGTPIRLLFRRKRSRP